MDQRKPYTKPEVKELGTVRDLTQTGKTNEGADAKTGSITHSAGT